MQHTRANDTINAQPFVNEADIRRLHRASRGTPGIRGIASTANFWEPGSDL